MYRTKDTKQVVSRYDITQAYPNTSFPEVLTPEILDAFGFEEFTPEPMVPDPAIIESQRVEALWNAAHDVEYNAISGSAIGLLTIGVIKQLPKSLAIKTWIDSLWTEYYTRKFNGSVDYDFSIFGEIPHSIIELKEEVSL